MKIGLVQAAASADASANVATLRRFAGRAAEEGCSAVCFPECFLTGYDPAAAAIRAVSMDAPILVEVAAVAEEYKLDILVGLMERCGRDLFITHGLFRRDGSRDCYRKTHLGEREACFFAAGDRLPVLMLSSGLPVGIQLCVESHFPEITQTLARKGAEVIFAPHAAPRCAGDRRRIWNKYIPARSYDNRIYLLCCNLWDEERFAGGCLVTDPAGVELASCYEEGSRLLTVSIDREWLTEYRTADGRLSRRFYPARRRPELYVLQME